ncbi:MAG: hypothetical protein RLZZ265_486 [Verrucomicrobiota bacterium]
MATMFEPLPDPRIPSRSFLSMFTGRVSNRMPRLDKGKGTLCPVNRLVAQRGRYSCSFRPDKYPLPSDLFRLGTNPFYMRTVVC